MIFDCGAEARTYPPSQESRPGGWFWMKQAPSVRMGFSPSANNSFSPSVDGNFRLQARREQAPSVRMGFSPSANGSFSPSSSDSFGPSWILTNGYNPS